MDQIKNNLKELQEVARMLETNANKKSHDLQKGLRTQQENQKALQTASKHFQ